MLRDGDVVRSGSLDFPDVAAGKRCSLDIPYGRIDDDGEYFLTLRALTRQGRGMVPAAHEVAVAQWPLTEFRTLVSEEGSRGKFVRKETDESITIQVTKVCDMHPAGNIHLIKRGVYDT